MRYIKLKKFGEGNLTREQEMMEKRLVALQLKYIVDKNRKRRGK